MGALHVQNAVVRQNIWTVMEAIRLLLRKKEERKKVLHFKVNSKTGLFEKATTISEKDIDLHLNLDKHKVTLQGRRFKPPVDHILQETCHYLEIALRSIHDLHELPHIKFEPSIELIKAKSILHEAWHALNREDAERMLLTKTPGTYLFRKDVFAKGLQQILSTAKKMKIYCFTLCYLDPTGQVRDRTIVQWDDHWMFYDDDPTLSGDYWTTLEGLLMSMGNVLKSPLFSLKAEISRGFKKSGKM